MIWLPKNTKKKNLIIMKMIFFIFGFTIEKKIELIKKNLLFKII